MWLHHNVQILDAVLDLMDFLGILYRDGAGHAQQVKQKHCVCLYVIVFTQNNIILSNVSGSTNL